MPGSVRGQPSPGRYVYLLQHQVHRHTPEASENSASLPASAGMLQPVVKSARKKPLYGFWQTPALPLCLSGVRPTPWMVCLCATKSPPVALL